MITKMYMDRNIRLFGVYKIFTKRVFLPLTSIYASQAAGLSVAQIGLIASFSSGVSLFFESSTGFWADIHGRKKSAQIGSLLAALGTVFYVFGQNFYGILCASIIIAIGYSFLSGAMEALIHDSLIVLGKEKDYAKIASRAQSLSLIANAIFITTIPLLYPIDKRLPFVAGFIAYLVLFTLSSLLTEPPIKHRSDAKKDSFFATVRKLINRKTLLFFVSAGFIYSVISGITDIFNLGFVELGMPPKLLGIVFGVASIVGAIVGLFVHNLKRLSFRQYATLDVMVSSTMFISFGILKSLPLAIGAFVINMSLWRFQKIMYQHYILELYGQKRYKATLLSLISNFGLLHEIWLAIVFSKLAQNIGILPSLSYGLVMMALFLPIFLLSIKLFVTDAKASLASSNH